MLGERFVYIGLGCVAISSLSAFFLLNPAVMLPTLGWIRKGLIGHVQDGHHARSIRVATIEVRVIPLRECSVRGPNDFRWRVASNLQILVVAMDATHIRSGLSLRKALT